MAYVPPHKRLSNTQLRPPPPELRDTQMKKKLNPSSRWWKNANEPEVRQIIYASHSISRCLAVPLHDDDRIPSSVHLVPVSLESIKWKTGEKPLTFVNDRSQQDCPLEKPWASVAEKVHSDLVSVLQNVKEKKANEALNEIKLGFVARFGKVLFHRSPSLCVDSLKEYSLSEASLKNLKRTFHTDLPISYVEHIKNGVVPKIAVDFEGRKERYIVKLTDAMQRGPIISCKCRIKEGERNLELYKIELNPVRHLIVDISCLDSSVDLRLALCTKKNMNVVTDEEKQILSDLISSATLDPAVKGGLRWPLNSGARYSVIAVWHTKCEFYSNSIMRLKVRKANRYDFVASAGDVSWEIGLKQTGIARTLMEAGNDEGVAEAVSISPLLEETLRFIWDHFLRWDGDLVSYCEP